MILLFSSLVLSTSALCISQWLGKSNPARSSALTSGMILLLLLLPFTLLLPKFQISINWLQAVSYSQAQSATNTWNLSQILLALWIVGSFFLLARLSFHYFAVRNWRQTSERCTSPQWTHRLHESCALLKIDSIPTLGICDQISSPMVTGLIYPQILLPRSSENWSTATINHVLLHELGHVKRRDLWVSVASHLACAIHWFNPLVWKLSKKRATQCEFACDAYVLASGANPKSYIHALCDVAEDATNTAPVTLALAMANKASLRQRVEILLNNKKASPKKWITPLILVTSSTLAIAINTVTPVNITQRKDTSSEKLYPLEEIETRLEANPFPGN